jgi:hypothetical protein
MVAMSEVKIVLPEADPHHHPVRDETPAPAGAIAQGGAH